MSQQIKIGSQKRENLLYKTINLYVLFISIFLCCSCNKTEVKWIDANGVMIWNESQENASYKWEGNTFDCVANGKGILHTYFSDGTHTELQCNAYYGALKEEYVLKANNGNKVIGKIEGSKLEGFGVQIVSNDIYIGNFLSSKPNGKLSLYKSDGTIHKGYWKDGKKEGEGVYIVNGKTIVGTWCNNTLLSTVAKDTTITFSNGIYTGIIKDEVPFGEGSMKFNNGYVYNGSWIKGQRSGYGVLTHQTDSMYGDWHENKLNGFGVYSNPNYRYEGEWTFGKPNGYGQLVSIDKTKYSGNWKEGVRTGWGEIKYTNGDSYEGIWEDDMYNGYGEYHYSNGSYVKGEWDDGLQNGYGSYCCKDFQYEGSWEDGWMNGEGHFTYRNGDEYFGNVLENQRYGTGYYKFKNGSSYEGEFIDDKINGYGTFEFNDGGVFEGEFVNGKIHGEGTLYIPINGDTIAISAQWNGTQLPTFASVIFGNGDVYEGELINGRPTTNGKWDHTDKSSTISNAIHSANDFYKAHKETWDKIVMYTSTALVVIEVTAEVAAPFTGGSSLSIAGVAKVSNIALNAVDASIKTASTIVDAKDAIDNGDTTEALVNLGTELTINAAFIVAPRVLKSSPARKAGVLVSIFAKKGVSKAVPLLKKSFNKPSKKLVKLFKGTNGIIGKKLEVPKVPISIHKVLSVNRPIYLRYVKTCISNSALNRQLNTIVQKGPIVLSEKEMKYLLSNSNPSDLRAYIKAKTGNKNNFQEFFIRLSMGNKEQTEKIFDNQQFRKFINSSIRGDGGYHEWQMTSKFKDYLLDPKWEKDGKFLALSINRFIQRTSKIKFIGGGGHPTKGFSNTAKSAVWHKGLEEVINKSSSSEELFVNIRNYAQKTLTEDKMKEFSKIFEEVLKQ